LRSILAEERGRFLAAGGKMQFSICASEEIAARLREIPRVRGIRNSVRYDFESINDRWRNVVETLRAMLHETRAPARRREEKHHGPSSRAPRNRSDSRVRLRTGDAVG
jgi:hypothetical protein